MVIQQAEKAQLLVAFLEFQALYTSPNFDFSIWGSKVMSAVFEAFRPWNVALTNISAKQNPANVGDLAILFSLQNGRLTFSVGIGGSTLVVTNPDWSQEQVIGQVAGAGLNAVQASAAVTFGQYVISLLMHVKPEKRGLSEITANFLNVQSAKVSSAKVKARGFSIYADDFSWVVDSSAIYDAALFLRIVRSFQPTATFSEIAAGLRADQNELFETLGLTVD
jgi:hypothetical protein